MSLLDRGNDSVTVFPEEAYTDSDGNILTRAAPIGTTHRAVVQPISAKENQDGGFITTTRYRLRLIRYRGVLGARSRIQWKGKRYGIEGEGLDYTGSPRTAHVDYVMVRK